MGELLPKGWVETELGSYIYLKNGYAYKTTQFQETGIPVLKISNITHDGNIDVSNTQFVDEKYLNQSFLVKKGDILIAMSGATTGKFGIYKSDDSVLQNQRVGNIKLRSEDLGNKSFVYYLIAYLKKEIEERAYGGAQPNISPKLIETIKIPLPPLAEQERIVAKLDALFAQIDLMKKSLAQIPTILKNFRQQVLTQAVTGKLTEKWREGKELSEWKDVKFKDVTEKITDGDHQAPPQVEEGVPFLVISDLTNNGINLEKVKRFVPSEYYSKIPEYRKPKVADVLYTVTGSFGLPFLVTTNEEFCFQRHIGLIRVNNLYLTSKYCFYFLQSDNAYQQARAGARGVAQLTVSLTSIRSFDLTLPSIKEQEEIVSRVESLFAKADFIESQYKTLKAKIENLPQSILHKAFKGELVAQLPTDGDAKDLLAEIKKLKVK